ncbi:aminotransferase class IV, partial [Opitutaceae bacterium]|nr:aminotransferase class IV [Opitutaceae bacterium]
MTQVYIQANTDGTLHDAADASVSPLNRSFLYGDAVYEVWRTYDGVVYAWGEHWQRLVRSADAVGMNIPWSAESIFAQVYTTVQAYRVKVEEAGELYIRLQISRGEGEIGLDSNLADHCRFVVLVRRLPPFEEVKLERGTRLSIADKIRRNSRRCL